MGTTLLTVGGWVVLCGFLLFFVCWVEIERAFFSGQDPEHWQPRSPRTAIAPEEEQPPPLAQGSHAAALERLA